MEMQDIKMMVEESLNRYFSARENTELAVLAQSMRYSLLAGGKRLRPILVLEFCRMAGGNVRKALPVACAIEMLHTYSLIHDDLPCMDNDDLRRGKPTNHVVYGETTAVLAGDALQAEAFSAILSSQLPDAAKVGCALALSQAAGLDGMCGGQHLDTSWEGRTLDAPQLDAINRRKTGALLKAACTMGVYAASGTSSMLAAAAAYGEALGLAFQIRDDILDVTSTTDRLGKPVGSDVSNHKNTYMALYGLEKCQEMVQSLTEKAADSIRSVFPDTVFLEQLARSMARREF